jgi:hypothetical protein
MKKMFQLTHPKIKAARVADAVRRDIKRYIKREQRKELPEGVDFWNFDCRFGPTAEEAESIHLSDISKSINEAEEQQAASCYIEILARPGHRTEKSN